jgi:hypothetical protein
MVMIFGYVLASLFGQGRNMLMMIPMMLSVVATITLAIYTNSKERKLREAAEDAYKRRISELRRKMESEHEQQRIYYYYNYPDSDTTLRISQATSTRAPEAQEEGHPLWHPPVGAPPDRPRLPAPAPGHQHPPVNGDLQNI